MIPERFYLIFQVSVSAAAYFPLSKSLETSIFRAFSTYQVVALYTDYQEPLPAVN